MQIWAHPESYLQDFYARAGDEWDHSVWDFRNPIGSNPDTVHLDVQFSRYRANGSLTRPVSLHLGRHLHRTTLGGTAAVELCRLESLQPPVRRNASPNEIRTCYQRRDCLVHRDWVGSQSWLARADGLIE